MNQETISQSPPENDSSLSSFEEMAASVGSYPLTPNYDEVSTISIQEPDPESADKMGADRHDLATTARDAEGHIQNPGSWLMLGKMDHEIEIGDYLSAEQVETAIYKEIAESGEGTRVIRYNPPKTFPDPSSAVRDIFAEAIDGHSGIKLTPDTTMPKHNAHGTEIRDTNGETFKSSNILLKNEVELPDGDYIHRPALDKAMENYGMVSDTYPLTPNYDEVSTISIQEPDPESADKMGADRHDLATTARDAEGHIQNPGSWLMLGKMDHEIEIGDYLSAEQVETAIYKEIAESGEGTRVIRYNPPKTFPDPSSAVRDIFAEAIDGHSGIKLTPDTTMPKHNAHGTEIRDTNGETFKSSNILLKNEVELPDGDYIHRPALDKAMENYGVVQDTSQDNQINNDQQGGV